MAFDVEAALAALDETRRDKKQPARALILPHDNPDPDSLASALGLEKMLRSLGYETVIGYGGIIGRPENRAMVSSLEIQLQPVETIHWASYPVIALCDTQPRTGNNSLPHDRVPEIVVDHHPLRATTPPCPWQDIRPEVGATATIVYGYLRELKLAIDPRLATAFLYALKAETRDLGREAGPDEREAYLDVMQLADHEKLFQIAHPKLGREHFVAVDRALRNAVQWGELLAINLGDCEYPDLVAEVADLMLAYDRCRWVLCVGKHDEHVFLSIRTDVQNAAAGGVIRRIVGTQGASGGHGTTAGGRLFIEVQSAGQLKSIYDDLVGRLCKELHITAAPTPLL